MAVLAQARVSHSGVRRALSEQRERTRVARAREEGDGAARGSRARSAANAESEKEAKEEDVVKESPNGARERD